MFEQVQLALEKHPKTRFEQLAKLLEESGELAQALLILQGKSPNKPVVTNADAVDEIADIMLCCLSLAVDLGASEEQLKVAVLRKLDKWIGR